MTDTPPPDIPADLPPLDPDLAAWLGSVPPPTMPPEVWDRLSSALAAEAPLGATEVASSATRVAGSATQIPDRSPGSGDSRRRTRWLWPALAGAASVALIGLVVVPVLRGSGGGEVASGPSSVEAGAEGSVLAQSPEPTDTAERSGDRSTPAETPASAQASPAESATASPTEPGDAGSSSEATKVAGSATPTEASSVPMPAPVVIATGTDYSPLTMPEQVSGVLLSNGMGSGAAVQQIMSEGQDIAAAATVGSDGFTADTDAMRDCLQRLGAGSASMAPLLVDRALFGGVDVGVVVLLREISAEEQPAALDVVVVDADCSDEDIVAAQRFGVELAP